VDTDPEAEPVSAGALRFAQAVAVVDMVVVAAAGIVCAWRGWTSAGEFATALFVAAAILLGVGAAPFLPLVMPGQSSGSPAAYELEVRVITAERTSATGKATRWSLVAFVAAAIAAAEAYAILAIGG